MRAGMPHALFLALGALLSVVPSADAQRLFFSKYIYAGQEKMYLEIHNPSCIDVTLDEFAIVIARDGRAFSYGSAYWLTGWSVPPGGSVKIGTEDFVIQYYTSTDRETAMDFLLKRSSTQDLQRTSKIYDRVCGSSTCTYHDWFDGNDAIGLIHNGQIIDSIGQERDPEIVGKTSWPIAGVATAMRNHVLIRKRWVTEGNFGMWTERGLESNNTEWHVEAMLRDLTDERIATFGKHRTDLKYPCSLLKATCATTGTTVGVSRDQLSIVCPPNCHLHPGKVVGAQGQYDLDSHICKSAIHANITGLTTTGGFPEEGRLPPYDSSLGTGGFSRGTSSSYHDNWAQIPAHADIIYMVPNGNESHYNTTSFFNMISHVRNINKQFLFSETHKRSTRVAVVGYAGSTNNSLYPNWPTWTKSYRESLQQVDRLREAPSGGPGEDLANALRLMCDRLIHYDVRRPTSDTRQQSPRVGVNKFLFIYLRRRPQKQPLLDAEMYLKCFTRLGFTVLTLTNSTMKWGEHFDNTLATSRDTHYSFNWDEATYGAGWGNWEMSNHILQTIWDEQMCWDRSYQTEVEKSYIEYVAYEMPYNALRSIATKCVASYNRSHSTAVPTVSPTNHPTLNPTRTPTTVTPTEFRCAGCFWTTDLTPPFIPATPAPSFTPAPTPEPPEFDQYRIKKVEFLPSICTANCNNAGACNPSTGTCDCDVGFKGPGCTERDCLGGCFNGGVCDVMTGDCICVTGDDGIQYSGKHCTEISCRAMMGAGEICNNRGTCDTSTGYCNCEPGWYGRYCEGDMCGREEGIYGCSNNGKCSYTNGTCTCYTGYFGKNCEYKKCEDDCSQYGFCDLRTGYCICDSKFEGVAGCKFGRCKNDCSGHGECDYSSRKCTCDPGWELSDCSRAKIGP